LSIRTVFGMVRIGSLHDFEFFFLPGDDAAVEVVDVSEAELFEDHEGFVGAAAGTAVEEVRFVFVELGDLFLEGVGDVVDVLGILDVALFELSGGADVEDDGELGLVLFFEEFGGGLGIDVFDGGGSLFFGLGDGEEGAEDQGEEREEFHGRECRWGEWRGKGKKSEPGERKLEPRMDTN
jgi:hypothetical protein